MADEKESVDDYAKKKAVDFGFLLLTTVLIVGAVLTVVGGNVIDLFGFLF